MEVGKETKVDSFAIAFRILFCTSLARLRHMLPVRLPWACWKLKGFLSNPRIPQAVLAVVLLMALLARRCAQAKSRARKSWRNAMRNALTYEEWSQAARMIHEEAESELYDRGLVENKLRELRRRRREGRPRDMMFCLRADLVRNLGNMCNPELHKGRLQVPGPIQEYIDEVSVQLRMVCSWDSEELAVEEKLAFLRETRHAFGRTALLLSGGASLGAFHVGVVKALVENGLLPRVVAGASVGSIMCAVVATRTWAEVQSFFEDCVERLRFFDRLGGVLAVVRRVLALGAVHEIRQLQRMLRELTGNMTFQEAYDMTGRVLGVSVCSARRHEPPRCLNYLTAPHVVIWSAVTASCAFPGLFQAQELMAKDRSGELVPYHAGPGEPAGGGRVGVRQWRDGSLESDLPMMQLMELFNVNHFIVSQANPHIAPLLRLKELVRAYGGGFAAKLAHLAEMEVKHRCNQILELGFPLGGIAKLFAQDWEGDVTVVMPATLAQLAKIIQNPSQAELQKAINQGRRCTWEKLSAIKANCGIELVLDECVSSLNRMRRLKKNAERAASQEMGNAVRFHGAKRIPSWICISRENSWGSLHEDDLIESTGGPWGGPSGRALRPSCNAHEGSDSESESVDANASWTRVGGPLMRTASATTFLQSLDVEGELNTAWNRQEAQVHDSSHEHPEGSTSYINSYITNSDPIELQPNLNGSDVDGSTCCCYQTRSCTDRICGSASRIAAAEGNFERSPTGIGVNVVKKEDIALVNGHHDVENYPNKHAFRIDESGSPIGSTGRDIDEDDDSATASDCSNIDRNIDSCEIHG